MHMSMSVETHAAMPGKADSQLVVLQDNGLVPIVEPEMTLGAGNYSIEDTSYWSERVLTHVFRQLNEHDVLLEGILMKPSMCLPGESLLHCRSAAACAYMCAALERII